MEMVPEKIFLENYLEESIKDKHRKNEDFLKLAITNVKLARKLNFKEGLTYDCTDNTFFYVTLPSGENVFRGYKKYSFPEVRFVITSHYVLLKNKWFEPANIDDFVFEVDEAYKPFTNSFSRRFIRTAIYRGYSDKIFEVNEISNRIKPKYLPVDIKL